MIIIYHVTELKKGDRVKRTFEFDSIDKAFDFETKLQIRRLASPELKTSWKTERR